MIWMKRRNMIRLKRFLGRKSEADTKIPNRALDRRLLIGPKKTEHTPAWQWMEITEQTDFDNAPTLPIGLTNWKKVSLVEE